MEFKIFKNKNLSKDKDKLYLAQPTMLFKSLDPSEYYMIAKHTVKDDDIVRPDRIAVEHYGSTDGLDIILKFNGVQDPFSINIGDTLWIPIDSIPYFRLESPQMYEENPIKNQFIQTKRLSKTDQRRLAALKKKYNKETLLPPNVIPVGRKNYEFDGTNVRLGMGPQTDAVVNSILKDIDNSSFDTDSSDDAAVNLVIDTSDNSQTKDTVTSSGAGSGAGKLYEDSLNDNNGKVDRDKNGSGSGAGGGAGTGNIGAGKTDAADDLGGDEPDGTAPGNKDDNPTNNPDAPCAK